MTGDRTIDKNKDLVIATTEILRNMIFSKDQKLTNTGLIILDEVLIFSAILTPTGDPITLFVFTIPLYLLIELVVYLNSRN